MSSKQQIGRLAMRVEGDWWVAYYAQQHTMEGALILGTISMAIVANKARKDAFMALMQAAISDLLSVAGGLHVHWPNPPQRAPESERSGRA